MNSLFNALLDSIYRMLTERFFGFFCCYCFVLLFVFSLSSVVTRVLGQCKSSIMNLENLSSDFEMIYEELVLIL